MIKLYDFPLSGHSHKVRLMLSLLGVGYERVEVNLAKGEQRGETFDSLNPFHHVPVLDDDGVVIRDSNAIIAYLARKYDEQWYPSDAESTARIQEWLAVSTKEINDGPASARLVNVFGAQLDHAAIIEKSHTLLEIIENHLVNRDWLALDQASIADVALYTYIAHAPEGDVSLDKYPHIQKWLSHIEGLKGFVEMPSSLVGLAA